MSLEDSINKLTVAVENLTQTITTLNAAPPVLAGSNTLEAVANAESTPASAAEPEAPKKSRKKAAALATTFQEAHQAVDELIAKHSLAPAAEPEVVIVVEPEPAPAPVAEPVKITLQDIRELAQVALDNDKLSGVIAINKKFGLRRISEATEDQYTEIHELLTKLTHGTS
jgi:septum formation inhibitor MinC